MCSPSSSSLLLLEQKLLLILLLQDNVHREQSLIFSFLLLLNFESSDFIPVCFFVVFCPARGKQIRKNRKTEKRHPPIQQQKPYCK